MKVWNSTKIFLKHTRVKIWKQVYICALAWRTGASRSHYPEAMLPADYFQLDFSEKLFGSPQLCVVSATWVLIWMESEVMKQQLSCPAFAGCFIWQDVPRYCWGLQALTGAAMQTVPQITSVAKHHVKKAAAHRSGIWSHRTVEVESDL